MAYLHGQGVFGLGEDDWDYLIANQWFPFIALQPDLRSKLIRFAKGRQNLDRLLGEVRKAVTEALPQMLERWRGSEILQPHIQLIEHAVARFHEGDYISSASVIYPRIEGAIRTLRLATGATNQASQQNLTESVISARSNEHHVYNLLVPQMFRRYLEDGYFAPFAPGAPAPMSRNSIGHGIALPEQFTDKAALIGLLTLDQVFFFLPSKPESPQVSAGAP